MTGSSTTPKALLNRIRGDLIALHQSLAAGDQLGSKSEYAELMVLIAKVMCRASALIDNADTQARVLELESLLTSAEAGQASSNRRIEALTEDVARLNADVISARQSADDAAADKQALAGVLKSIGHYAETMGETSRSLMEEIALALRTSSGQLSFGLTRWLTRLQGQQ